MSQVNDPPSLQDQVVTVAGSNQAARYGIYVDPDITTRNASSVAVPAELPEASGSTTLGGTRPVYANDQNTEIDNTDAETQTDVDPPPASPNHWARGTVDGSRVSRDPYSNKGMVGQDVFKNAHS